MRFLENIKVRLTVEKKRKLIGYLLLLVCFFVIGYLVKNVFLKDTFKNEDKPIKQSFETIKKEEELNYNKTEEQEIEANITIDESVKYDIPEEIISRINFQKFDSIMKEFLKENNLYTKDTIVVSDYILTENFKTGEIEFRLSISNYSKSIILVKVNKDKIELSYY